jgi:hypothetical protein
MLLSGHQKHQLEVGLSLPNPILDQLLQGLPARDKFLAPVTVPMARSTALIGLIDTSLQTMARQMRAAFLND